MRRRNRRTDGDGEHRGRIWGILWKVLVCAGILSFLAVDGYKFVPRLQYWWRNRQIKQEYVIEVDRLHQEQQQLKEEIYKLEHSLLTQERLAREMGFIKPGETVYKFRAKGTH
jgi:cell division protein FtsB